MKPSRKQPRRPASAPPPPPARHPWDLRLGTLALRLLLLLTPFWITPHTKDAFRQPKLLIGGVLALACLFFLAWGVRRVGKVRLADLWRNPAVQAVIPLLVIATLGLAATRHPFHFREALIDFWIGCACLVGWSLALDVPRLERLLRFLLWPASLLGAVGLLQALRLWEPLLLFNLGSDRFAVTSFAGNPGDLGAYLVLPALIAQWNLVRGGKSRLRVLGTGLALAICVFGVVATQTLTAVAALAIGSVVLWLALLPRRKAVLVTAGGLVLVVVLALAFRPLRERVLSVADLTRQGNVNSALSGRLDGWNTAVWMLRENPLTGVGQGGYLPEFSPAKLALLNRGVDFYPAHPQPVFANAHNDFLEAGAEWGVPGLLALGWALWVLARSLVRGGGPERDRAFALAGVAAFAVLAFAHFPFHMALTGFPALLFLAWIFRRATPSPVEETEARGLQGKMLVWPLILLLLAGLVFQTRRWRARTTAARLLYRVEALSMAALSAGRASPRLFTDNLAALDRAARLAPAEVGIPIARAAQYLLLNRPEPAIPIYEESLKLEPRPEAYQYLGLAQRMANRPEEALRSFRTAVRLDPSLSSKVPPEAR